MFNAQTLSHQTRIETLQRGNNMLRGASSVSRLLPVRMVTVSATLHNRYEDA